MSRTKRTAELGAEIIEWAKRWRHETCSRLGGCDQYDGSHDEECQVRRNEAEGVALVDALELAGAK